MKRVALIGAWGYGNVGDDTYPLIWRHYLPDIEFSLHNSDEPRSCPDADLYLFGGGGIVFDNGTSHFDYMKAYVDEATERGIPYAFASVGVQIRVNIGDSAEAEFYDEALRRWAPVLRGAAFVTVRDPRSRSELEARGVEATQHPDLCYLIPGMREPYEHFVTVIPGPGVSTTFHDFLAALESQLHTGGLVLVNTGYRRDDFLIDSLAKAYSTLFAVKSDYASPELVRDIVRNSRYVFTGRYHGMVFARAAGKPYWVAPVTRPAKIAVEDLAADPRGAWQHVLRVAEYLGTTPAHELPGNLIK